METERLGSELPARLLSVGEVAYFLGVHPSTVRRWEKSGLLKSYAIGLRNNLRFKQEDIIGFLHENQEESTQAGLLGGDSDKGRHKIKAERK